MRYFSNLFWYRTVRVLDRFTVHYQESSTVYTAICICHTGCADYCCVYNTRLLLMDNLSETCRVLYQNKFEKLVHLVGFYYENIS
jgi:hypothetical protein